MLAHQPDNGNASAIDLEAAMHEAEQLSSLIGEIYDAALDPTQWRHVIGKAGRFVGCMPALPAKDSTSPGSNVTYLDDGVSQLYRQLDASADLAIAICPQRDADDGTRRRMHAVVPHLRRAMQLGRMVDLKTSEAATFADTLDGLSAGIGLIDADGGIVHANASFRALLATGDALSDVGGRLIAADAAADQALRDAFAAAGRGSAATSGRGMALPLMAGDGGIHVAHLLPLTCGTRRPAGMASAAVAALIVHKTELPPLSHPEMLARHYRLTATELRVLLAIVDVGGVPDVAAKLGIAYSTAKTHLSNLFEKTGTRRQADLVKIVAGFATPFVDAARREITQPVDLQG